ncbi:MAG: hypothetical protein A2Z99_03435 [Treponema sp. GWB1_62_6]|nr:MAG: hypothetical protein A2Y36_02395 [Treponema sp. GWA1_62_8]OHE64535.1 MAG: hypothetical protein A2Z99_03435 [Treponema sp. GWB1_62_6]OHE67385.1 MAG: hypothetical protein A2001_07190 [Treponema sp. GWC1_61_84]OHE76219.1 MAG: hypothetical protein A2413_01130 [Treponema sp. RIFOXYC1_FULL_61_9]HCM27477.1 3-oxoacyl-ACP reductase [Treponema sp.]
MNLNLESGTFLVAASSEGLGYATAAALADEGARVWIGSRDIAKVSAALDSLRERARKAGSGAEIDGCVLDMTESASIEAWVLKAAEKFGPDLDGIVCNSGGPPPGRFADFDDDQWKSAFDLLVMSAVRLVRASLPGLSVRGGAILVVSSTSVKEPIESLILSNSLRSATAALAKTLSAELAPLGIRVNCLAPGRFATGRVSRIDKAAAERRGITAEQARAASEAVIPLARYGDVGEFGRTACWLLSPAASYLTGQIVSLDGGSTKGVW